MPSSYGVKEEIKLKTDIVGLISEYVKVKKAGASFMAVCPFHQEKTPSLHISPDKGMWYCHGCGEGGDAFGFVMRMEGVDFREAMVSLAKKAGVTMPEYDNKEQSERDLLIKINGAAARYYNETLKKSTAAAAARAYVAKRKMTDATVEEFMIGYAPDAWDAVLTFLKAKNVTEEQIFKAGLASRSEKTRGFFDRFRNRLMFPIRDHNGNVVGFTARVMPLADGKDPKDEAKYINTSQTLIYNKSHVLYGLDGARQEIKKKNLAVVVEGNMDVIASHQAGVKYVVGSSGTSFTAEQLVLLKRFTDRLVLSFDNDAAGETAARRSIDAAVAHGFAVRILRLPDGVKDPDDCVKRGADVWEKAIADAVPYMEWFLGLARSRTDLRDPDAVRVTSDELLKEIAKLSSPVERSYWLREMSRLFDTPETVLFEHVTALRGKPAAVASRIAEQQGAVNPQGNKKPVAIKSRLTRQAMLAQHALGLALKWPELAGVLVTSAHREWFADTDALFDAFAAHSAAHKGLQPLRGVLEADGQHELAERASVLEMRAAEEFGELDAAGRRDALVQLSAELKQLYALHRQKELRTAMVEAERSGDTAAIADIARQLHQL